MRHRDALILASAVLSMGGLGRMLNDISDTDEQYRTREPLYDSIRDPNMSDEELNHIRSLSKKDRKAYMKNRRGK